MIIWLNGTFGVGKTTLSEQYVADVDGSRIFNPEHVGYMLGGNLRDIPYYDFQDLPPWRRLVPTVLKEIDLFTGVDIVAPQSVLKEGYWHELRSGLAALDLDVLHVVLDCDPGTLTSRIQNDEANREPEAMKWRMDHLDAFVAARPWLQGAADLWLDTTGQSPTELSKAVQEAVVGYPASGEAQTSSPSLSTSPVRAKPNRREMP